MEREPMARTLDLAKAQLDRLQGGDFDAYAAHLPEYAIACRQILDCADDEFNARSSELGRLVEVDLAMSHKLASLKAELLERMASLRRAEHVASAYFATPESTGRPRHSA